MRTNRRGQIPLWMAVTLAAVVLAALVLWTRQSMSSDTVDGKQTIVFWGAAQFGEDIYNVIHQFEQLNPQYKVITSTAVARDLTGDAQRLMCAVAGGVPPDVVFFDRFAIGEWAGRGALTDLRPFLRAQDPKKSPWDAKYGIALKDYYERAVMEASYAPPGDRGEAGIYGIPTTFDIRVLYSNADLLRQEEMVDAKGEPSPPKNWDELRAAASRLTRFSVSGDKRSTVTRLGFAPNYGNAWLYMYAWQAGGEFMNEDRTRVTLTSDPVVRALQFMVDIYDDLGGYAKVDAFQSSFQAGELDPFLRGQIAMKIDGDWSLQGIADWRPNMDFVVSPAPMPQDQLDLGRRPITWAGGWSLVIPSTAQHKEGAFKLIQYLASTEVVLQLEQANRERKESEGRIYTPRTQANRATYQALLRRHVYENPAMPPRFREAYGVLAELLEDALIRPVTPVGQLLWAKHREAYDAAVNHTWAGRTPAGYTDITYPLARAQQEVQQQLDEIMSPAPPESRVSWTPYFYLYGAIVAAPFGAMAVAYRRRRRQYGYKAGEVWAALMFASPWIIGFVALVGGPILFSILISFTRYDVLNAAHYVGLENYRQVFEDPLFATSLWNTAYMVLRIPLTMAVSLGIAILLNQAVKGIGFYRTVYYMPAIVPLVASSLLWIWIFNPSFGALNTFLGWLYDTAPFELIERMRGAQFTVPLWLQDPLWSKPSLILMNLWAAGGGMIIWLAGLQSIPQQLYEAAEIDGANRWQRFWNVTIPMLSPYILFNAIIGLIGTMQIFGEAFIMTEGGPSNSTLFYAYHLFKQAFQFFRMGYASALAWILFVVVLALTMLQLWASKKWVHYDQA